MARDLKSQKRHKVECLNLWCGWVSDRLASASVKPCPKCRGPVLPRMVKPGDSGPTTRGRRRIGIHVSDEDAIELRAMGGGSEGEAATQIVRGVLAHRRAERLAGR